jgi:hypothetical protein
MQRLIAVKADQARGLDSLKEIVCLNNRYDCQNLRLKAVHIYQLL